MTTLCVTLVKIGQHIFPIPLTGEDILLSHCQSISRGGGEGVHRVSGSFRHFQTLALLLHTFKPQKIIQRSIYYLKWTHIQYV